LKRTTASWARLWRDFGPVISLALVPILVGVMQSRSATEAVREQYVALAIGILSKRIEEQPDIDLRKWAVEIVKASAPVPLSATLAGKLSGGAVTLTSASGTLSP
jgi:hypothetical protein